MRRTRRPRIRTLPGGTDRRRRHRFPADVPRFAFRRPSTHPTPTESALHLPSGDVDALLWGQSDDLVSAASER
jgi:hypothetical protein